MLRSIALALTTLGCTPGNVPDAPPPAPTPAGRLTPWSCSSEEESCPWDCSGEGLEITTPGIWAVDLTAACTLRLRAWGAGGGGGSRYESGVYTGDPGGGGGGGTLVMTDDGTWPGMPWVIGGGGGGGGKGHETEGAAFDDVADPSHMGGGGGGGGFGEQVAELPAGTRLRLYVGGGGSAGCASRDGGGLGGAPEGGDGREGGNRRATFGGGRGAAGDTVFGGGGGGMGDTIWGGGGGAGRGSTHHGRNSKYGEMGGRWAPNLAGGGGGGASGLGTVVVKGLAGGRGDLGGAGGSGAARLNLGSPFPGLGLGGDGGAACDGANGGDGRLELVVEPAGTGDVCPSGRIADCQGGCAPAPDLGDGVCDPRLDCPALAADGGDCPEAGLAIPDWMVARCPTVTAQSAFCVSWYDDYTPIGKVVLLGLDDGEMCGLVDWPWNYDSQSPYWQWDRAVWKPPYRQVTTYESDTSDGGHGLRVAVNYELRDGFLADLSEVDFYDFDLAAEAMTWNDITTYGAGLYLFTREFSRWYPGTDGILTDAYVDLPKVQDQWRLESALRTPAGVEDHMLYHIPHPDGDDPPVLEGWELLTGELLPVVPLTESQPRSAYKAGIDVVDGNAWIVAWGGPLPTLRGYRLTTGAEVRRYDYPGSRLAGLSCYDPTDPDPPPPAP